MSVSSVVLGLNQQPVTGTHSAARLARQGTEGVNEGLSLSQVDASFAAELRTLTRFHDFNSDALYNRRTQLRQRNTQIRIISLAGYAEVLRGDLRAPWAQQVNSSAAPTFRYIAPRTSEGIRKFRGGISLCVMHSFGRDYDIRRTARFNTNAVRIDPATGHNPRRFANGVASLLNPGPMTVRAEGEDAPPTAPGSTAIHHAISLRGDVINSVSWDNRCIHGAGAGASPADVATRVTDTSIGIEHEAWLVRVSRGNLDVIVDQGPFSEEQYAMDAFILKKLEAYTGKNFRNYLGTREDGLWGNISSGSVGCFNHKDTSAHDDPGSEFFLPLGFRLGDDFSSIPNLRAKKGKWERRMRVWWSDVPQGSQIGAYDRIFSKMDRMRSFSLQSEVFDPSLRAGPLLFAASEVRGPPQVAVANASARDTLQGATRSQQMQRTSRSLLFAAAQGPNAALRLLLATQSGRLTAITMASLRLPVIVDAVGFNYTTGTWVERSTRNSGMGTTTGTVPTVDTAPPTESG